MGKEIFLFIPNIVGYIRLFLVLIAWMVYGYPLVFLLFYCTQASLDALDGLLARYLNQTSAFGAWLDVVVDILGRGLLWCRLYPEFGFLVISLEWLTFVCTHNLGCKWKQPRNCEPWLVKRVMANNFRTMFGCFVIAGIHILPIWLYAHYHLVLSDYLYIPNFMQYLVISILASARAVATVVEVWYIWSHIQFLVSDEMNKEHSSPS